MTENKFLEDSIAINLQKIENSASLLMDSLRDKNVEKYHKTSRDHNITIKAYLEIASRIDFVESMLNQAIEYAKGITFKEYPQ
jgi:hypothetical protein